MRFFLLAFLFALLMALNVSADVDCGFACTMDYTPVCAGEAGSEQTYPNECALQVHNCKEKTALQVIREGEC